MRNTNITDEGDTYFNASNVTNTATTVVAAATNTKGMYLTNAMLLSGTAADSLYLVTATSAPAAYNTAGNGIILMTEEDTAVGRNSCMLPYPIFIPAGRGLYAICPAVSGSGAVFATTKLAV